jgi:hypothetical protein
MIGHIIFWAASLWESMVTKRVATPIAVSQSNIAARYFARTWQDKLGWGLKTALYIVALLIESGYPGLWGFTWVEIAAAIQALIAIGQQMGWWEKVKGMFK